MNSTITITICDQAENHVGMQKLGEFANKGFDLNDLMKIRTWFENKNTECELLDLNYPIEDDNIYPDDEAYILIVRNAVSVILEDDNDLMTELTNLNWDKKAFMYGRVVNKNARHNLCFANNNQKPNYAAGRGRIVAFKDVPLLEKLKNTIQEIIGDEFGNLVAEGNYYYDAEKCGIAFHGDSERLIVIGIRLGATIPLVYQWYFNSKPLGEKIRLDLNDGDIYFMSEKATGNDWKKKLIYTLRHAAGSKKYTD